MMNSMTWEIARRELRTYLFSPIGWLVIVLFIIQIGSILGYTLSYRSFRVWSTSEGVISLTYNLLFSGSRSLIIGMSNQLYLFIPLLTMGLISREYSEGTIRLLFSSPINTKDIVLGKYVSVVIMCSILSGIMFLIGISLGLFVVESMDYLLLFWGIFMLLLLLCTYSAIGLFISSLTRHQFVAAIGVVGILFGLGYLNSLNSEETNPILSILLEWLSGITFLNTFKGYVGLWDLGYFVLFILMFLAFTMIRLNSIRTTIPWWYQTGQYIFVLMVVLGTGYILSSPDISYYLDVRRAELIDTKILINRDDVRFWNALFQYVIPSATIICGTVLVLNRRKV